MEPWMNTGIQAAQSSSWMKKLARSVERVIRSGGRTVALTDLIREGRPIEEKDALQYVFPSGELGARIFIRESDWNDLLRYRVGPTSFPTVRHYGKSIVYETSEDISNAKPFGKLSGDAPFHLDYRQGQLSDAVAYRMELAASDVFPGLVEMIFEPNRTVAGDKPDVIDRIFQARAAAFLLGVRDWLDTSGDKAKQNLQATFDVFQQREKPEGGYIYDYPSAVFPGG